LVVQHNQKSHMSQYLEQDGIVEPSFELFKTEEKYINQNIYLKMPSFFDLKVFFNFIAFINNKKVINIRLEQNNLALSTSVLIISLLQSNPIGMFSDLKESCFEITLLEQEFGIQKLN
ncbi:hypothetical protein BpHYR1_019789, partial [Brachionus plicatilis]